MSDDYYELLGVERGVGEGDLKKAYRKLAMQCHPDRNPGDPAAEERFKAVSEAYGVLSDPQKRQIYDRYGKAGLQSQGYSPPGDVSDIFSQFSDLFGDFFGIGAGRRGRGRAARGADLRMQVQIDLEQVLQGVERDFEIPRTTHCDTCAGSGAKPGTTPKPCATCAGRGQVAVSRGFIQMTTACPRCRGEGRIVESPCRDCGGSGGRQITDKVKVRIPPGIEPGMKLRVSGKGERAPTPEGEPGDLFVIVQVADHPRFERHGTELLGEVEVDMVQACLGAEVPFETLDGTETLRIAPGTQPGELLRLRSKGMPSVDRARGRGDLHLRVVVRIPKALDARRRELLEAFRDSSSNSASSSPG